MRIAPDVVLRRVAAWGRKETSEQFVMVMGRGRRYSIENYLLDPLLVGVILLKETKIEPIEIGLSTTF